MPLPDPLTAPVPYALLTLVLAAGVHWQTGLTYSEVRAIQRAKIRTFPALEDRRPFGYGPWVTDTGGRDDPDFIASIPAPPREVFNRLKQAGASPHVIVSIKRRPMPEHTLATDEQYSHAHLVWMHGDGTQTEAYLFKAGELTDVYAHHQPAVTDAIGHLTSGVDHGDPRDVVRPALGVTEAQADA